MFNFKKYNPYKPSAQYTIEELEEKIEWTFALYLASQSLISNIDKEWADIKET